MASEKFVTKVQCLRGGWTDHSGSAAGRAGRTRRRQLQKEDGTILIQLVSPVSKDRVPKILKNARGFVYCVSSMGVTGQEGNLPPSDFRIPDSGKERGKDSGYDGIWYPHGGGCTSDERDY